MRCLAAIDCGVEQESDKSANFIDKCEKTDRMEPWNLKLFQLNKISCFGVIAYYVKCKFALIYKQLLHKKTLKKLFFSADSNSIL